jgi:ferrous iron transport protein A
LWLHPEWGNRMDSCRTWHGVEVRELAQASSSGRSPQSAETASGRFARGQVISLAQLHQGDRGYVSGIAADANAAIQIGDVAHSTIARRLVELGFVPGEPIEVVREIWPGGDPMAVRIGASLFALRRREAQSVLVSLSDDDGPAEGGGESPAEAGVDRA